MIQKALKLFFLSCILVFSNIQAQTVNGTITDALDGTPLPGVNVIIKGTSVGVSSDFDGKFSIDVKNENAILQFSFMGYSTQEVSVKGRSVINISLVQSAESLNEVVVTALGIKKEQRALGYATSTVKAAELVKTSTPDFASALYGKATGVQIASTAGGSTSAVNITVRGVKSITGRSQPLIIMDGVPFRDNEVDNTNYWADQRIRGNGLLDLNPEDVEDITILKGASAAALYGSEAVNGVVLITTKKGKAGKMAVDFSTSYSIDKVAYLPRFQNVRGPGAPLNVSDGGQDSEGFITYDDGSRGVLQYSINFGPEFDGQPIRSWDGVIRPYSAQKDPYAALFQDAHNSRSHVSVSNGNENSNIRFAFTHLDNEGLSIGAKEKKNIINLNTSFKTAKNITTDLTVNYINQTVYNRPYSIDRMINNFGGMLPRFDNGAWYKNRYQTSLGYKYVIGTGESLTPDENIIHNGERNDILDYMWRVHKHNLNEKSNRVVGILTNTWQVTDGLSFRTRVSTDFTNRKSEDKKATEKPLAFGPTGEFVLVNDNYNLLYGEALLTYTKAITPDLNLTAMGGYNGSKYDYTKMQIRTDGGLSVENWFDLSASVKLPVSESRRQSLVKDAFLGMLSFDYKNYLFLEGTIRKDRTSTMNPNQNAFSYPSLNSSFVFSDAFDLPDFINYAKLRGSWGIVGNYPDIYLANIAYTQKSLGSQGSAQPIYTTVSTDLFGNDNIRPEEKHEYEFGLEAKLFNNRLGLDIGYYNAKIVDQILPLTLPQSTGARKILTNIGTLRNSGIEIGINARPIETEDFSWTTILNVSKNINKIEKLSPGLTEIVHRDFDGNAAVLKSVVGQPMGDIYAHPVAVDAEGNKIVDPNGMYKVDPDRLEKFGNAMPKAIGGFLNSFKYKNFNVDIAFDFRYGGHIMPTGLNWMTSRGLTEESIKYRDNEHGGLSYYNNGKYNVQTTLGATSGPNGETVYHDGILLDGVQLDGSTNDHVVSQADYYWTVYNWGGPQYSPNTRYELYIKENNYVKLRELSIGYSFPRKVLDKIGISKLQLSAYGRNLFFVYRSIKDMDPEQTTAGSRWFENINSTSAGVASRTYGLMLRASL